jgi:glycerate kinase
LLGGTLQPGVDLICDSIGFDKYLVGSDLVITGEGRIDFQTAFGKTVVGIGRRARAAGIPVIAICGELGQGYNEVYQQAMREAKGLLQDATERTMRLFCLSYAQPKDIRR